jgi:hypothetical protein
LSVQKIDKLGRPNAGWSYVREAGKHIRKQFDCRRMVSFSQEDADFLGFMARRDGVPVSEVIRMFVAWGIETEMREEESLAKVA